MNEIFKKKILDLSSLFASSIYRVPFLAFEFYYALKNFYPGFLVLVYQGFYLCILGSSHSWLPSPSFVLQGFLFWGFRPVRLVLSVYLVSLSTKYHVFKAHSTTNTRLSVSMDAIGPSKLNWWVRFLHLLANRIYILSGLETYLLTWLLIQNDF